MSDHDPSSELPPERLESIPWAQLASRPPTDRRRQLAIAAGLVVVVALSASAARTLWPVASPRPTSVTVPQPTSAASQEIAPVDTTEPPLAQVLLSEADLMAIDPAQLRASAAAYAEWYLADLLTVDAADPTGGDDESSRSFVESAVAVDVQDLDAVTHEVTVVVRSLSAHGTGPHLRIPPRAFSVVVRFGDDGPSIIDLPAPAPLPVLSSVTVDVEPRPAPEIVIGAALEAAARLGAVDESSVVTGWANNVWRVEVTVRDDAGVPTVTAVWLDGEGSPVAPPQPSK